VQYGHILVDTVSEKMLTFKGAKSAKEGMTVVITIIGGGKKSRVGAPMVIFKNAEYNYPIGIPDVIGDPVTYRTSPKAFIDGRIMYQYLTEGKTWGYSNDNRVLWMGNYSGHEFVGIETLLGKLNTVVKFFPGNATDLVQACDSFVIQKFKQFWAKYYEIWRLEAIRQERYKAQEKGKDWSGKLDTARSVLPTLTTISTSMEWGGHRSNDVDWYWSWS
jgi:hypothetical protein